MSKLSRAGLGLTLAALTIGAAPFPGGGLPFEQDDFDAALSEARARSLPLFIENWAPW